MGRFTVADSPACEALERTWKLKMGNPYDSSAEDRFQSDNARVLRGRPAPITQLPHQDGTVDVKMES